MTNILKTSLDGADKRESLASSEPQKNQLSLVMASQGEAGGRRQATVKAKVVLLGEGAVGKTSIVLRYSDNKFNDKHEQTLQVGLYTYTHIERGWEGGREREGGREGGRERERGREGGMEGGREREREGWREGESGVCVYVFLYSRLEDYCYNTSRFQLLKHYST